VAEEVGGCDAGIYTRYRTWKVSDARVTTKLRRDDSSV